ncbi:MAG: MlaD family protein, partial [Paracoccaceae bacterium]
MAENRLEILTGAVVLIAAAAFFAYAGHSSGLGGEAGTYPLKASFRSIEGVLPGSDVKLAGVKVGTLSSMALNPT